MVAAEPMVLLHKYKIRDRVRKIYSKEMQIISILQEKMGFTCFKEWIEARFAHVKLSPDQEM